MTGSTQTPPASSGEEACVWDISLTGTQTPDDASIPLRLLNTGGGSAEVWRLEDGQWRPVEAGQNGQYLLLTMEGTQGTFCVVSQASQLPWLLIGGGGALAALLVLAGRRIKNRRAVKASASAAQPQEDTEPAAK